jgi:hypothetical protein
VSSTALVPIFGVVFAPDPERAALGLERVRRDRIVLTAWKLEPPEQNAWTRFFVAHTSPWPRPDELERLLPGFRLAYEEHTLSFEGASGAELWDWLVRASP